MEPEKKSYTAKEPSPKAYKLPRDKLPYFYGMLAGFGAISLSILFFFVLYRYQGFGSAVNTLLGILSPFIYGAVIAYLLKPICNTYDDLFTKWLPKPLKKLASPLSVALAMITGAIIVYTVIIMILPDLVASVMTLVTTETVSHELNRFIAWLEALVNDNPVILNYIESSYASIRETAATWLSETFAPSIKVLVSGVGVQVVNVVTLIKNVIIGIMVAIYLLGSRRKFGRQATLMLYAFVPTKAADWIYNELLYADKMFNGFISGKLLDSAIIGFLCYVVCFIAKFPNALLVSAIIGITNVIPYFGPFIGAVPATLLIFIDDPLKAVWFVVFVLILQQIDGNIIGPKILGDSTGLSSFWVLFSILLFGGLWGFAGMLVGVPLFAVIYDVIEQLMRHGLRTKKHDALLEAYGRDFCQSEADAAAPAKQADR